MQTLKSTILTAALIKSMASNAEGDSAELTPTTVEALDARDARFAELGSAGSDAKLKRAYAICRTNYRGDGSLAKLAEWPRGQRREFLRLLKSKELVIRFQALVDG